MIGPPMRSGSASTADNLIGGHTSNRNPNTCMKIEIEVTEELLADLELAGVLCPCDWSDEMADAASRVCETMSQAIKVAQPPTSNS